MTTSTLAMLGGKAVRRPDQNWPAWPQYDQREEKALLEVLHRDSWLFGPKVQEFEAAYAAFQGADHCISCNSGTAAAEIILQAMGIGAGDEVLVPPYTFIATASAVLRVGATPVFVDLDDSWCMDPDLAEKAITQRTRAIMPVHFGGRICDMDKMNELGSRHGIPVIEDACHSWGGRWKSQGTGTIGACGFFSFQASKNITAGEGGGIVTNDEELAAKVRSLTNCGRGKPGSPWYYHLNVGTNARLSEFQAAILVCQLERAEEHMLRRAENASILNQGLEGIEGLHLQRESNRITRRAWHLYCLRLDESAFGCTRERFVEAAVAEGLPITAGYPMPIYKQPVFQSLTCYDYSTVSCPFTEDLCEKSGMWLPHQILLGTEEDMHDIVAIIRKIKENASSL